MGVFNGGVGAKADHVRAARAHGNTGKHCCHWTGCRVKVPPAMFMCFKHWKMLPREIQREIWRTYRIGQEDTKTPSSEYIAAAKRAQTWIAENHPPESKQERLL